MNAISSSREQRITTALVNLERELLPINKTHNREIVSTERDFYTAIGRKIYRLRKARNLLQKELAEKVGVTFQTICKWENGENILGVYRLVTLAHALNVSVLDLLPE